MDPDDREACSAYRQAEQAASQILKTGLITVALSACHSFETEKTSRLLAVRFSQHEHVLSKTVAPVAQKKKMKTIYLTFDDGPNKGTRKMMQIVQHEQVHVSLFIIGEHVRGSREQTAIFDSVLKSRFFEIANHSYTHAFHNKYAKFYEVPDSALSDFKRCADSLGLTAKIIRTPGRNIWRTQTVSSTDIKTSSAAADSFYARGYKEVGWDLEWQYDDMLKLKKTSDEMVTQVDSLFARNKTKTPGHLVILAHDQVYADADDSSELHHFIIKLKAKNEYDFETVSNYPGIKN